MSDLVILVARRQDVYICYCSYYQPMTEPLTDWFVRPSNRTPFGPERNLYANVATKRFLFWSSVPGRGWSMGPERDSPESYQNSRNGENISNFQTEKYFAFQTRRVSVRPASLGRRTGGEDSLSTACRASSEIFQYQKIFL